MTPSPDVTKFREVTSRYLADVMTVAEDLFAQGCAQELCVRIALQIVDARDVRRAREMQSLLPGNIVGLRRS